MAWALVLGLENVDANSKCSGQPCVYARTAANGHGQGLERACAGVDAWGEVRWGLRCRVGALLWLGAWVVVLGRVGLAWLARVDA